MITPIPLSTMPLASIGLHVLPQEEQIWTPCKYQDSEWVDCEDDVQIWEDYTYL